MLIANEISSGDDSSQHSNGSSINDRHTSRISMAKGTTARTIKEDDKKKQSKKNARIRFGGKVNLDSYVPN